MPKVVLKGCQHPICQPWGDLTDDFSDSRTVTCLVCYERLIAPLSAGRRPKPEQLTPAPAPQVCVHGLKTPIPKDPKFKATDYQDALCEDCGVVIRHPEGRGSWEEVIFNGYVIREEP